MSEKQTVVKNKKRNYYVVASIIFIAIGCIGTFASQPGIYSVFFAIGVAFLILALAERNKISKK